MKKKFLPVLLAFALALSILPPAFAASDEAVNAANALHEMGLFNGTGTDANGNPVFELDRQPTRNEAVTMLVRLLGKEAEAKAGTWSTPFTDVADWAKPYVGYAYANGLTTGDSPTTFGGEQTATSAQYITFVLRALGYQSGTDFQWDRAWELSDQLGFTPKRQYENGGAWDITVSGNSTNMRGRYFVRGDIAAISYNALSMKMKGADKTLLENVRGGVSSNVGEHTHVYLTKTVPGSGHYEQVQVGTEKVQVGTEKRQYYECLHCGTHIYSYEDWEAHTNPETSSCLPGRNLIHTEYVPVYEEKPVYENKWVEDSPTTIRVCEICGQKEP